MDKKVFLKFIEFGRLIGLDDNMKLFYELYTNNLLRIDWSRADLGLSISRLIDEEIKDKLNDSVINDFMNYITEITDYVTQRSYEITDTYLGLKEVMGESFEELVSEAEKSVTVIEPSLESIDVEYLTKRSYRDIKKVLGHNVKLKFRLNNNKELNMELDEQQLNSLSEAISLTLEDLKELNKN